MSETDAKHLRLIQKWIDVAESDYEACLALRALAVPTYRRQIVFHAQQSVEKYIKTWLELKKTKYPYTHDISRLLEIVEEHGGAEMARSLEPAETLNPYAVQFRYPFERMDLDDDDIAEAIEIATKVRLILREAIRLEIKKAYGADESEDVKTVYREFDLG